MDKKLEIINRALIQSYALEGSYPACITHLRNFGVNIDEERFIYFYEPFGQFLPTVKIFRRDGLDELHAHRRE